MIAGKRYQTICVRASLSSTTPPEWVPVIGTPHDDEKFIGFKPVHLHIDWRFLDQRQRDLILDFGKNAPHDLVIATVYPDDGSGPTELEDALSAKDLPKTAFLKRASRTYHSPFPPYPERPPHWLPSLSKAYQDARCCPAGYAPTGAPTSPKNSPTNRASSPAPSTACAGTPKTARQPRQNEQTETVSPRRCHRTEPTVHLQGRQQTRRAQRTRAKRRSQPQAAPDPMNAKTTETGQPTQATCWCGAIVHATTRACPCGGGFTVTEHENCGMVISAAHAQSCTYIADNIDTCATCGRDNEHCGGNSIFSNQQEPSQCRTPARA